MIRAQAFVFGSVSGVPSIPAFTVMHNVFTVIPPAITVITVIHPAIRGYGY